MKQVVLSEVEPLTCPIHSDRLLMTVSPPGFSIPSCHLPLCRQTIKQNTFLLKTKQTCHATDFFFSPQILGQRTAFIVQSNLVILPQTS